MLGLNRIRLYALAILAIFILSILFYLFIDKRTSLSVSIPSDLNGCVNGVISDNIKSSMSNMDIAVVSLKRCNFYAEGFLNSISANKDEHDMNYSSLVNHYEKEVENKRQH